LPDSGDHQTFGNHPDAKNVFDIDSCSWSRWSPTCATSASSLRRLAERARTALLRRRSRCAFRRPARFPPVPAGEKGQSGANFIQTQLVYDIPAFQVSWMKVRELGLHKETFILAGVGPLKSPAWPAT
jgi:methylenetetrahydrofolate reductase (NADPH)